MMAIGRMMWTECNLFRRRNRLQIQWGVQGVIRWVPSGHGIQLEDTGARQLISHPVFPLVVWWWHLGYPLPCPWNEHGHSIALQHQGKLTQNNEALGMVPCTWGGGVNWDNEVGEVLAISYFCIALTEHWHNNSGPFIWLHVFGGISVHHGGAGMVEFTEVGSMLWRCLMVGQELEKAGRTRGGFHLQVPSLSDLSLLNSTQPLK